MWCVKKETALCFLISFQNFCVPVVKEATNQAYAITVYYTKPEHTKLS